MAVPESEVRSTVEALPIVWRRVMTDPHGFFSDMPETGGLEQPGIFLVACAAVNALGHLLLGGGLRGVLGCFLWELVAAVVVAAVFVLVAQNLFEGRAGFEATFRVVAYAAAASVVFWVPLVGAVALLYSAYLALRGLERVHGLIRPAPCSPSVWAEPFSGSCATPSSARRSDPRARSPFTTRSPRRRRRPAPTDGRTGPPRSASWSSLPSPAPPGS